MIWQHRGQAIRDAINEFEATLTEAGRDEERRLTGDARRMGARTICDAIDRGDM